MATGRDRSRTILVDAGRAALGIANPDARKYALRTVAETLAAIDPAEAERIARDITDAAVRDVALDKVAIALMNNADGCSLSAGAPDQAIRPANQ
jgi:hypothetical protein